MLSSFKFQPWSKKTCVGYGHNFANTKFRTEVHILWLRCFPTITPPPTPRTHPTLPAKPSSASASGLLYTHIYTHTHRYMYDISLSLSLSRHLSTVHYSLLTLSLLIFSPAQLPPEILSTTTAPQRNCSLWISNRMVKAGKWFRGLLGLKKPECAANPNQNPSAKPPKRRWSFVKSNREKEGGLDKSQRGASTARLDAAVDPSKHAVAVAAATAKVAEAAIAAAQAAAAVVQLTSSGRSGGSGAAAWCGSTVNSTACINRNAGGYGIREELAAVKIQSHFRAYLVTFLPLHFTRLLSLSSTMYNPFPPEGRKVFSPLRRS